jgi:hypothetical protein
MLVALSILLAVDVGLFTLHFLFHSLSLYSSAWALVFDPAR